jgi:hypothetical protein
MNSFYRTLSFEYTFKHNADCVFFAYSMPYTYSNLLDYLDSVEIDETKSRYIIPEIQTIAYKCIDISGGPHYARH